MRQTAPFYSLNRGEVSVLALGRVDVERLRLSAEIQVNFLPRVLGPAMLRPGLEYILEIDQSNPCRMVGVVYGATDTALLEFTDAKVRPIVNEAPITRVAVSTVMPAFSSWAATASEGATVNHAGNVEILNNLQGLSSKASATVTVASGDQAKEHAIRMVVDIGPVTFRIGTAPGIDDIFENSQLEEGTHSLAFTPNAGTVYVEIEADAAALRRVSAISFEAAGVMSLPSPYSFASLAKLSFEFSGDEVFIAGGNLQQRKIVRYGARSYSIVKYNSNDGPFPAFSGDSSIAIRPTAGLIGNAPLQANRPVFKASHVNSLVRLFHVGQHVIQSLAASDTYTRPIRVAGVSKVTDSSGATTATTDRQFSIEIAGTWSGTLTLERSLESEDSGYTAYATYTDNTGPTDINDNLDNIVAWYRMGFGASAYSSGKADITLAYAGGGGAGIGRIQSVSDAQNATVEVIEPFVANTGSTDWRFQEWSDAAGWPTANALHEGRMWWFGASRVWGSVSDAYDSFDLDKTGDAGPISRSIGRGPIQTINWAVPLTRLVIGADSSIITARSNSFDEPLTPTVFTLKDSVTIAASALPAVRLDTSAVFVSQSGRKAYELSFNVQITDFEASDLTRLNPDIGVPGFVDVAVQREPETRIHFVRGDGQVAVLLYDKADQVEAWYRVQTDGVVENVVVLPGPLESRVFYVVRRTVAGRTKRYLEKCARMDECVGGTLNKIADSFLTYSGAATTTLTGLDHLEGRYVVVWADGQEVGLDETRADPQTYRVGGGMIALPVAVQNAVVGLPYIGQFKSAKLAYAAQEGTALNQVKRVSHVGMLLANTHALGVKYGPDFDNLDDMPWSDDGQETAVHTVWAAYDEQMIEFPGNYDTDARLCLQAQAPRPCTVLGFTIELDTNG